MVKIPSVRLGWLFDYVSGMTTFIVTALTIVFASADICDERITTDGASLVHFNSPFLNLKTQSSSWALFWTLLRLSTLWSPPLCNDGLEECLRETTSA